MSEAAAGADLNHDFTSSGGLGFTVPHCHAFVTAAGSAASTLATDALTLTQGISLTAGAPDAGCRTHSLGESTRVGGQSAGAPGDAQGSQRQRPSWVTQEAKPTLAAEAPACAGGR